MPSVREQADGAIEFIEEMSQSWKGLPRQLITDITHKEHEESDDDGNQSSGLRWKDRCNGSSDETEQWRALIFLDGQVHSDWEAVSGSDGQSRGQSWFRRFAGDHAEGRNAEKGNDGSPGSKRHSGRDVRGAMFGYMTQGAEPHTQESDDPCKSSCQPKSPRRLRIKQSQRQATYDHSTAVPFCMLVSWRYFYENRGTPSECCYPPLTACWEIVIVEEKSTIKHSGIQNEQCTVIVGGKLYSKAGIYIPGFGPTKTL
ncbi:hypothetical protein C8J56DRAFT_886575 [Mycena floridula]|nr:hypothetical protein C8J56DRAFT_886575 [Mycena floridula]